jgi:hypothetical protein
MVDLTLRVHRQMTENSDDRPGILAFHRERAQVIHGWVDELGLEVKDWGETDSDGAHEDVDFKLVSDTLVGLASAGVFTALVDLIKTSIRQRKVHNVWIIRPDGTKFSMRDASVEEILKVARALGVGTMEADGGKKPVRRRRSGTAGARSRGSKQT